MKRYPALVLLVSLLAAVPIWASLTSSVRVTIHHRLIESVGLSTPADEFSYSIGKRLSSGTGSAKCDQVLSISRTLAAGASEGVDLVGSETNPLGETVNLTRVRMLYLENTATGTLEAGGAIASAFEGWISAGATATIQASGVLLLIAPNDGWVATDSVSDILRLSSPDGTAYKLWAVGANE